MSFRKGLVEIWEDMMSYRTLKVVKISDKRLAYVHKSLMASILIYATITMVGAHTYMLKEKPRLYVTTTIDDSARLSNWNLSSTSGDTGYCNPAYTAFPGDELIPEPAYPNTRCASYISSSQMVSVSDQGAFVGTHMRQQPWKRTCADEAAKTDCVVENKDENGADADAEDHFAADIENIKLTLQPIYVTSWGVSEAAHWITVVNAAGKIVKEFERYDGDADKRWPTFTLKELLTLAELDVDAQNPVVVSKNYQGLDANGNPRLPLYRLTGLRVAVDFKFSNFRPMSQGKPFDFTPLAVMSVKATSVGSFVSPVEKTVYSGSTSNFDSQGTTLSIRGVKIEFQAKGLMGKADGYTGMMALMSCLVMVGVATAIVDVIGAFIYDSFKDDKIEDDSERQHLEHMILNIETSGVPFKNDDFEFEPGTSVKKQIDELTRDIQRQATLLHHMSGELAAAGLNSHTMHMKDLGEGVQSARYECVLKGPNGEDIFLTGGPQTVGRGHGGTQSKRISHKQISVVANTHNGMARVQGLSTKNVSGVALGGGPWQPLGPEAAVDLKNGDMIALLMDEGADEHETTVDGVFRFQSRYVEDKQEGGSWFGW